MKAAQLSFSSGEFSPSIYGRLDFAGYQSGAKLIQNFITKKRGGVQTRPGTEHVGEAPGAGRLLPFRFNANDVYVLEFTDYLMRVIAEGAGGTFGYVLDGTGSILEVVTPYAEADLPLLHIAQSADVMFLVHESYAQRVLTRLSATSWSLELHDLVPDNDPPADVDIAFSGSTGARSHQYKVSYVPATGRESDPSDEVALYTSVPWSSSSYATLFWQSLTGVDEYDWGLSSANRTSIRTAAYQWISGTSGEYRCELAAGGDPSLALPPFLLIGGAVAPQAVSLDDIQDGEWFYGDEDSLGFNTVYVRLSGGTDPDAEALDYIEICSAPEYYLTSAAGGDPGFSAPDNLFENSGIMPEGTVGSLAAGEFVFGDNDSLGYTTLYVRLTDDASPADAIGGTITWTSDDQYKWVIYKNSSGIYGWAGETQSARFVDDGLIPDYNFAPQNYRDPFVDNYPTAVVLHQQRLFYAGTSNYPQTFWASQLADFNNFGNSFPLRVSDAIEATIGSKEINAIRHMLALDSLILFTDGAEWKVTHNVTTDFVSPVSLNLKPISYTGCSRALQPLGVDRCALYAQRDGKAIRELRYSGDAYTNVERSVLADHLVEDYAIIDWAYQQHPNGVVWCVREDGSLLGFTYLPEHDVYAWHRHDTEGEYISVCSVPGDGRDDVFFIAKRTINGATKYHVERQLPYQDDDIANCVCVDDSLRYDGAANDVISGLGHLEGETVDAITNEGVVRGLTVSGGSVTLPFEATSARIGLPFTGRLQTLPLERHDAMTVGVPRKNRKTAFRLKNSREFAAGPSFDKLTPIKLRTSEDWGDPTRIVTEGVIDHFVTQEWERDSSLCIETVGPLPLTILSLVVDIDLGDE